MPINPFLNGPRFHPEDRRILGVAFELVGVALRIGDSGGDVKQAIATKIIELAKAGERNPDILCEQALNDISGPPKRSPSQLAATKGMLGSARSPSAISRVQPR